MIICVGQIKYVLDIARSLCYIFINIQIEKARGMTIQTFASLIALIISFHLEMIFAPNDTYQ